MYTWILVFLLCSWKLEILFLKLKDQSYRLCIFNKQNNEKRLKKKKKNEIEPDLNPHLLNAKHILLNVPIKLSRNCRILSFIHITSNCTTI